MIGRRVQIVNYKIQNDDNRKLLQELKQRIKIIDVFSDNMNEKEKERRINKVRA